MQLASDPEILLSEVKTAIELFGDLQEEHSEKLMAGDLQNVTKWSDSRSKAMGRLQHALSLVWQCDSLQKKDLLGEELRRDLGEIIAKEQALAKRANSCKSSLNKEMATMRRGKNALGSYGNTTAFGGGSFKNVF